MLTRILATGPRTSGQGVMKDQTSMVRARTGDSRPKTGPRTDPQDKITTKD